MRPTFFGNVIHHSLLFTLIDSQLSLAFTNQSVARRKRRTEFYG